MNTLIRALLTLAGTAGLAHAQGINLDVGVNTTHPIPSSTYGAASGQSGFWNGSPGLTIASNPVALVNTDGSSTGVMISGSGGNADFQFNNANTAGDDDRLLDDLYDASVSQWEISGLQDGKYNVYVYSWAPDDRTGFKSNISVMGGSKGTVTVGGGVWNGSFVHGVHYMDDQVTVTGGSSIMIDIMIPTPASPTSLNGIQIEPVPCTGAPTQFCTAKAGLTCGTPAIAWSGVPSATAASGFTVSASPARSNRSGILLYNSASAAATVFQGGTLCIQTMGLRRAGSTNSMGTCPPSPVACDGVFSLDMNTFAQDLHVVPGCNGAPSGFPSANPAAFLTVPGTKVFAQWWGRDSNPTGSFVSDGVSYTVCP